MIRILIAVVVAAAITISTAIVQGRYLNRWGVPPDLTKASERLEQFPAKLGDWTVVGEGEPLTASVIRELGVNAHFSRVYRDSKTGDQVSLLMMAGAPGRLVRHPPTVCYANRANRLVNGPTAVLLGENETNGALHALQYEAVSGSINEQFIVAFGFSDGSAWEAPDFPRIRYGASPYVYKVQILQVLSESKAPGDSDVALPDSLIDFCSEFGANYRMFSGEQFQALN